jgi:hypothetical protein
MRVEADAPNDPMRTVPVRSVPVPPCAHPLQSRLLAGGPAALMSVAIGLAVPVANLLAVGALSRERGAGLKCALYMIAFNPFLLASVAGVLVGLSG